jgi:hypothetical protein
MRIAHDQGRAEPARPSPNMMWIDEYAAVPDGAFITGEIAAHLRRDWDAMNFRPRPAPPICATEVSERQLEVERQIRARTARLRNPI